MMGGYNRFGSGRQILFAIFLLVLLKMSESIVARPLRADAALWALNYVPALLGMFFVISLLALASRPVGMLHRPSWVTVAK